MYASYSSISGIKVTVHPKNVNSDFIPHSHAHGKLGKVSPKKTFLELHSETELQHFSLSEVDGDLIKKQKKTKCVPSFCVILTMSI